MPLSASQATHPGKQRESNEDACRVDAPAGLAIVCDGVGGREAGEVASQMGCETVAFALRDGYSLLDAVRAANDAVIVAATGERHGMATTLVAARIIGKQVELVWAGDSMAYLLEQAAGRCRLLTPPHSLVAELVDLGKLTPEEAVGHPLQHTITQYLGVVNRPFKPSAARLKLREGDRLLLCTDGVSDVLDEAALWALAGSHVDILAAADAVVDDAVTRSGHDNTTAVVLELSSSPSPLKHWLRPLAR